MPLIEELMAYPYEEVRIRSHDGHTLVARYYQVKEGAPVYLVHGTGDTFVPSYMSERIHEANKEGSHLLLVEGADHGMSFMTCPERYKEFVGAFVHEGEK